MSEVYFENDRLRLVEFTTKHLTVSYVGWLNDPVVVEYSEQRHFKHNLESCQNYYNDQIESDNLFIAIEAKANTSIDYTHIGNIGVSLDIQNKYADISILIGETNFWGKGIGLLAITEVIAFLYENKNIQLISCGTVSLNIGMIKLMEKLKMNPTLIFPKRFLINGQWADLIEGFLLNPKFEKYTLKNTN